jgi:hypothetical protein
MSEIVEIIKDWAATRPDEVVFDPREGYYSYDFIVDSFQKGKEVGRQELISSVRLKYHENIKKATEAIDLIVKYLFTETYTLNKLFINNSIKGTSILFAVKEETYLNDTFLDLAYSTSSKIELDFFDKGVNIQIGFLNDSKSLNSEAISEDGYSWAYDLISNSKLY